MSVHEYSWITNEPQMRLFMNWKKNHELKIFKNNEEPKVNEHSQTSKLMKISWHQNIMNSLICGSWTVDEITEQMDQIVV